MGISGYFKNLTHLLNSKFFLAVFYKPEYLLSLLEKMLAAFFRIRSSVWAFFRAFFKSIISF
jgi:hypothetical protein